MAPVKHEDMSTLTDIKFTSAFINTYVTITQRH